MQGGASGERQRFSAPTLRESRALGTSFEPGVGSLYVRAIVRPDNVVATDTTPGCTRAGLSAERVISSIRGTWIHLLAASKAG